MKTTELRKIRKNLPKGSIELLATRFDCSIGHVRNVLSGVKKNQEMIIAATEIAEEFLKKYEKAQQFAKGL